MRSYGVWHATLLATYGPNVVPLVFGLSGQLATESARWLATVVSEELKPQLRFFKLHCTALLIRMVDQLEQSSLVRRARSLNANATTVGPLNQPVPESRLPVTTADDLAAFNRTVVSVARDQRPHT